MYSNPHSAGAVLLRFSMGGASMGFLGPSSRLPILQCVNMGGGGIDGKLPDTAARGRQAAGSEQCLFRAEEVGRDFVAKAETVGDTATALARGVGCGEGGGALDEGLIGERDGLVEADGGDADAQADGEREAEASAGADLALGRDAGIEGGLEDGLRVGAVDKVQGGAVVCDGGVGGEEQLACGFNVEVQAGTEVQAAADGDELGNEEADEGDLGNGRLGVLGVLGLCGEAKPELGGQRAVQRDGGFGEAERGCSN